MSDNMTRIISCPRCKKPVRWENNPDRPFCSEQCRLIDLGCWASEDYRVAGQHKLMDDEPSEDL